MSSTRRSQDGTDSNRIGLFRPTRQTRAFEDVIAQIRGLIAAGDLNVGDKLPSERALADKLSVSRHTLREALRMLEISGIISLRRGAHGGAFITDPEGDRSIGLLGRSLRFTDISIADLTEAMRAITTMLAEAAITRMDEDDARALEANIAEAEAALDSTTRSKTTIRFYVILAEASRNRIFVEMAEAFSEILLSWVLRLGSLNSTTILTSRKRIIGHLKAGNLESAKMELERHVKRLHDLWLRGSDVPAKAKKTPTPRKRSRNPS